MYCACHTKGSRGPAGPTRRNSTRRLCALRLQHEMQPRPSGAHALRSLTSNLSVLRLPHEKAAAAQRRPRAPQLDQEAPSTAPATREAAVLHLSE